MSKEQKYEEPDFTEEEGKMMDSFWEQEEEKKPKSLSQQVASVLKPEENKDEVN